MNAKNQLSIEELVTSLAQFPPDILPAGVIREISDRGPSANPVLLSRLEVAINNADGGVGAIPPECFWCYALLQSCPDVSILPTIEKLSELDEETMDEVVGELLTDFTDSVLARMGDGNSIGEILAWLGRLMENNQANRYLKWNSSRVLGHWVNRGLMQRDDAIEQLTQWIEKRSDRKHDELSAGLVCTLSALRPAESLEFLEDCFRRHQIDTSIITMESVKQTMSGPDPLESYRVVDDLIEYFSDWDSFPFRSESLDPRATNLRESGMRAGTTEEAVPSKTQADAWLDDIRKSNDEHYPQEAVENLGNHASHVIDRLVGEVRRGIKQVRDSQTSDSNGPFLAATILAAQEFVANSDVFLEILDLPDLDREQVFGDTIGSPVVAALSASLLGQTEPFDRRIDDPSLGEIDRATMVLFYPFSVYHGYLQRDVAIAKLIELLERHLGESEVISAAIYDALCLMSVSSKQPTVANALERGVRNFFLDPTTAQRCIDKPRYAKEVVEDMIGRSHDVDQSILRSCMFSDESLNPEGEPSFDLDGEEPFFDLGGEDDLGLDDEDERGPTNLGTIVNDPSSKVPRNALCPCGSGKKYKRCCSRKDRT